MLYSHTNLDVAMEKAWSGLLRQSLDEDHLQRLMATSSDPQTQLNNPLRELILPSAGMLNFFNLPKRKLATSFGEVTSAHRDSSLPLAPDFTFHLHYSETEVVLYEDHGPGCIYRIYLFPQLPTQATLLNDLTARYVKEHYLSVVIDDQSFYFSLEHITNGDQWPFLAPVNKQDFRPASGLGSYTPFCYQNSSKISYEPKDKLPANLLKTMINCSSNELYCPVHIYSAVSRHKYPTGVQVPVFSKHPAVQAGNMQAMEHAVQFLSKPESSGPDNGESCMLRCTSISVGNERRMVYESPAAGVVTAFKLRVYDVRYNELIKDWSQILISMQWDDALTPQVDRVPLGSFFGATGSMSDFRGATMGHRRKTCLFVSADSYPNTDITGYFYFPMPYWKNARIFIEAADGLATQLDVCYQVTSVKNYYDEATTGYFHAHKSYYTDKVEGWREVLTLEEHWGHVAAVFVEVDNLRARRTLPLPQRWMAFQADPVIFIDGSRSASIQGTGLEDYFSYAHGFNLAENTTTSFVGVYHTGPWKNEPLSYHCFRLHILDPIPFSSSLQFIMEGMGQHFYEQEQSITYEEHWRRRSSDIAALSHTIFYYARPTSGGHFSDMLQLGETVSETNHNFEYQHRTDDQSGKVFKVESMYYVGNTISESTYDKEGRHFFTGDQIRFTLKLELPNIGAILRREFYSPVGAWTERLKITVNNKPQGQWIVPMGTLSEKFSLREDDFLIHRDLSNEADQLDIVIEALTDLHDIAYHVFTLY